MSVWSSPVTPPVDSTGDGTAPVTSPVDSTVAGIEEDCDCGEQLASFILSYEENPRNRGPRGIGVYSSDVEAVLVKTCIFIFCFCNLCFAPCLFHVQEMRASGEEVRVVKVCYRCLAMYLLRMPWDIQPAGAVPIEYIGR